MRKTFLIDTNVLLDDPDAIYKFKDNEVVIDFRVLLELDGKKNEPGIVGKNARQVARNFLALFDLGDPKTGVSVNKEGGTLRFYDSSLIESSGAVFNPLRFSTDTHLFDIAKRNNWILVTKDKILLVRALLHGAKAENYQNDTVVDDYTGHINASASADLINHLYHHIQKSWCFHLKGSTFHIGSKSASFMSYRFHVLKYT
jgi:PhoH-like ATPase